MRPPWLKILFHQKKVTFQQLLTNPDPFCFPRQPSRSNLHIVIRKSRPNSSLIYSGYTPRDILDYTEVTLELHQRHCLQNLACQWRLAIDTESRLHKYKMNGHLACNIIAELMRCVMLLAGLNKSAHVSITRVNFRLRATRWEAGRHVHYHQQEGIHAKVVL